MNSELIIWFTGQPGAGKTTLARALHEAIPGSVWIDGDDLRSQTGNQDYSDRGRAANVREAQRRAVAAGEAGQVAIVSLVSPFRCQREDFKAAHNVLEVYVHPCRVPAKEAFAFPAYAPPLANFIDVNTTGRSVADCAAQIEPRLRECLPAFGVGLLADVDYRTDVGDQPKRGDAHIGHHGFKEVGEAPPITPLVKLGCSRNEIQ